MSNSYNQLVEKRVLAEYTIQNAHKELGYILEKIKAEKSPKIQYTTADTIDPKYEKLQQKIANKLIDLFWSNTSEETVEFIQRVIVRSMLMQREFDMRDETNLARNNKLRNKLNLWENLKTICLDFYDNDMPPNMIGIFIEDKCKTFIINDNNIEFIDELYEFLCKK